MRIKLRKARLDDSKLIYEWRNNKLTREMSLNSNLISWESHCKWFRGALKRKDIVLMICIDAENHQANIAMVRLDIDSNRNSGTVSINLSPNYRGKSLGSECLNAFIDYLDASYKDIIKIRAIIKEENIASIKAFEKAGFLKETELDDNQLEYLYLKS